MLELLGLLISVGALVGGYQQARRFVLRRLRFVDAVHTSRAPILAGLAATALAVPLVWLLPLVGGWTAVLFGVGVGAGVAAGSKDARRRIAAGG